MASAEQLARRAAQRALYDRIVTENLDVCGAGNSLCGGGELTVLTRLPDRDAYYTATYEAASRTAGFNGIVAMFVGTTGGKWRPQPGTVKDKVR